MTISELIPWLENHLRNEKLPGVEAHRKMASRYYKDLKDNPVVKEDQKKSAVCLLLYPKGDEIHFLLILRPKTHAHHAGQIALPGGSCESDEEYQTTAIRELQEETGIEIHPGCILGNLSPVYIPATNFFVQPMVAGVKTSIELIKTKEADLFFEIPLKEFLDPKIIGETTVATPYDPTIHTPYFNIRGYVLWGATAMILNEFREVMAGYPSNAQ